MKKLVLVLGLVIGAFIAPDAMAAFLPIQSQTSVSTSNELKKEKKKKKKKCCKSDATASAGCAKKGASCCKKKAADAPAPEPSK